MRLRQKEKQAIIRAVHSIDSSAKIYLFGSRLDDEKKGGDIDIIVISEKISFSDKLTIRKQIFSEVEEQKVDITIGADPNEPFLKSSLQHAVLLR